MQLMEALLPFAARFFDTIVAASVPYWSIWTHTGPIGAEALMILIVRPWSVNSINQALMKC